MASAHGIYVMQRFRWNASNALFMDREPMCIEEVWASIQQVGTSSLGPGLMGETHRRMCALGTGEGHTPESPHNIPRWVAVHARKDFSMETRRGNIWSVCAINQWTIWGRSKNSRVTIIQVGVGQRLTMKVFIWTACYSTLKNVSPTTLLDISSVLLSKQTEEHAPNNEYTLRLEYRQ